MEVPAEVLIHNEILGLKGGRGTLIRVSAEGYYEVNIPFGQNVHRVMLPVPGTVLISREPEAVFGTGDEIER
jgi:hypothetical protein